MKIADLPVIVTGAASGLGAATARFLADRGARIALFDRDAQGEALAAEIGGCFFAVDIANEASIAGAVDGAVEWFGAAPRALVHCAGIVHAQTTLGRNGRHTLDAFTKVIDVNLSGTFALASAVSDAMAGSDPDADGSRGAIVLTASVAAFDGQRGQVAYAASKSGVAGMVLPLSRDLARNGIRVNAIAPGLFKTPMLESLGDDVCADLAKDVAFPRRLGNPEEFAHAATFLIENKYMNGATLRLDGGIRLP
ncbi:SDR family oxidoreductase [Meridianimarinicoccus aquatilis]|uniref:SDR family oxidoreductase n=1 Tax=Meridianimarinicoccus aquatilis TaxID=2552766 RepID=A0A4V3BCH8_9RHOB|nr:SDR family oxidoreductase [Fluviibacterium aquatile]TDL90399.1 SDR family oxidoreductase [Fluviibacterium aquatile]